MEIDAASEDVGTGQTLERQLCPIGAATDGFHLRLHSHLLHGHQHLVDDVHLRSHHLLHVIVLVLHFGHHRTLSITFVHPFGTGQDELLARFKLLAVVVAYDIAQLAQLGVGLHANEVVEALIALGGLGGLVGRQHGGELDSQTVGIHHLTLGIARMHAHALDGNLGRGGVEVLKLQLAHFASVHRVGPVAAELRHVEVMGTHANLLVGVEGYANLAVPDVLVVAQIAHRLHDFGNAGLVVGTEQCVAVGHNEVFAHVAEQFGKLLRTQHNALGEQNVASVVLLHDARFDVGTATVGAGVVVGNEAYRRHRLIAVG